MLEYYRSRIARIAPTFYLTAFLAHHLVYSHQENFDTAKVPLETVVFARGYFGDFRGWSRILLFHNNIGATSG